MEGRVIIIFGTMKKYSSNMFLSQIKGVQQYIILSIYCVLFTEYYIRLTPGF